MRITRKEKDGVTLIKVYCNDDDLVKVQIVDDETLKEIDKAYHYPRYTAEERERFKV